MPRQLSEYATGVANGNGIAIARVGPKRAFERWHITGVTIGSTSNTLEPECTVYLGAIGPSYRIGGTYSGKKDSGSADDWAETGRDVIAVWTGADVGSTCDITLSGEVTIGGA